VRHPRCVGSVSKKFLCITHTVEHNCLVVFDCMCNRQKKIFAIAENVLLSEAGLCVVKFVGYFR